MKALILSLTILVTSSMLFAQGFDPAQAGAATGINKAFYEVIHEQPVKKEGIFYIDENFYISHLIAYNLGQMKDVPARYDLFTNQFEIAIQSLRYALRGDLIKSFSWYNTDLLKKKNFVNTREFKTEKELKGFFEVVYDEDVSLLFHQQVAYYSGTNSPSVNNNASSESMTKVSTYYLATGGVAHKVTKSKKKNQKIFGAYQVKMSEYIKKNRLNYKQQGHLVLIAKYYNDLISE